MLAGLILIGVTDNMGGEILKDNIKEAQKVAKESMRLKGMIEDLMVELSAARIKNRPKPE